MPRLILAESVQRLLNSYDRQDELYLSALLTLYSILMNPTVDNENKFSADYFPNRPGTIEFSDRNWYIAYVVRDDGDVYIARMYHKSTLRDFGPHC